MGNRLCKKKNGDTIDHAKTGDNNTFDRIITRLHLRPNSWKSESQLNKQVNRSSKSKLTTSNNFENSKAFSRSSDWVDASLEVPDHDSPIHLRNPKLTLIFNQEDAGTPTPPPRKHKKGIREKIEAVAKSGLQAFQQRKPVEEPLCVKKKINYDCPCDRLNHKHNHVDHNGLQEKNSINKEQQKSVSSEPSKEHKRKKNLSVVSLPNYSDLKFSITNFGDIDRKSSDEKSIKSSNISLPGDAKKSKNYMIRCRSFGSLLPQQLLEKLKPSSQKIVLDVESDDSFGPLEDWDLGLIEHYNPRDASLPRPRKPHPKSEKKVLSDIESLIVKEDSQDLSTPPTESKVKILEDATVQKVEQSNEVPTVEHSSLMRILEEFSVKDKNNQNSGKNAEKREINEGFIVTEKLHGNND